MHILTKKCAEYISTFLSCSYTILDFTWFDQSLVNKDFQVLKDIDLIIILEVADPIWFTTEKIEWIKKQTIPIIFIGVPNNFIPTYCVPLISWFRFREQKAFTRNIYEDFYVSINGKTHPHRVLLKEKLNDNNFLKDRGIFSFDSQNPLRASQYLPDPEEDIVTYQYRAQLIDDYQLFSMFEIVCETQAADNQIFLSEKSVKAISTESPLFLAGCKGSLQMLKSIYGFKDFTQDDSYDLESSYDRRLALLVELLDDFYQNPQQRVFDNAKFNMNHLYSNFDQIHDTIFESTLYKVLNKIGRHN